MSDVSGLVDAVEKCAYDAWPAEEVDALAGWRLRATRGVTRRGNSVWPAAADGDAAVQERIVVAERWYAARRLPTLFQMSPLAASQGLDEELERRGYAVEAPTAVQTALTRDVASLPREGTRVGLALPDDWFEISGRRGRFADVQPTYRDLLERVGVRARFALAEVDGRPAAVGLGVLGDGFMGVSSMLTLPERRRSGAARRVLSALAACALQAGIPRMYLQVERQNAAALALYGAASFRELYGYHYRAPARHFRPLRP